MYIIKTILEGKNIKSGNGGCAILTKKSVPLYQYLQPKKLGRFSLPPSRFYILNQRVAFLFFQCK